MVFITSYFCVLLDTYFAAKTKLASAIAGETVVSTDLEGRGKGARKRQGTAGIPPLPKPKAARVAKKSVVEEELVPIVEPSESESNSDHEDIEEEDSDGSHQRKSRNQIIRCPESEEENDNTDDDNSSSGKTETVTKKKKTPNKEVPKEKKAKVVKAVQKDKGPNSRKLPAVPAGLGFELVTSPVLAVKSKQPQNQGIFLLNRLKII